MDKPGRRAVAAIMIAMGVASAAGATAAPTVVAVRVINQAQVEPVVMVRALSRVEGIFKRAGVEIDWVHDGSRWEGLCLILILAAAPLRGAPIDGDGLGFALAGGEATNRVAYVFGDRVRRLPGQDDYDVGTVLAHVMAHELGHLLLPAGSHVSESIMQARWNRVTVHHAAQGRLLFTVEHAARMRDQIAAHQAFTIAASSRE